MKLILSLLALNLTLWAEISLPQNFKTDFHQTISNEQGKVIKYDGSVLFKNLNQDEYSRSFFKWSYTSPTQKEVCTDGTQLIVVDHDLEQVSSYLINDGINLEAILNVAKKTSSTNYKASYKDVEYLLTLDAQEHLKEIVYVDNLENDVKIIFTNMNYDTTLNDHALECNVPQEYDIIKG